METSAIISALQEIARKNAAERNARARPFQYIIDPFFTGEDSLVVDCLRADMAVEAILKIAPERASEASTIRSRFYDNFAGGGRGRFLCEDELIGSILRREQIVFIVDLRSLDPIQAHGIYERTQGYARHGDAIILYETTAEPCVQRVVTHPTQERRRETTH
jgi:hypothetical protein